LRKATSIPAASGERVYGRWAAHDYLRAGALSVVQGRIPNGAAASRSAPRSARLRPCLMRM